MHPPSSQSSQSCLQGPANLDIRQRFIIDLSLPNGLLLGQDLVHEIYGVKQCRLARSSREQHNTHAELVATSLLGQ